MSLQPESLRLSGLPQPTARLSIWQTGLYALLSTVRKVTFEHVKSHDWHPWNEAADVIAEQAVENKVPFELRFTPFAPWAREDFKPAAWAHLLALDGPAASQYPFGSDCQHKVQAVASDIVWARLPQSPIGAAVEPWQPNNIKVLTWNTLSLLGRGAREALARQLAARRVHAAGLQETRARRSGTFERQGFLQVVAAATPEGQYGCELWFALGAAWATRGRQKQTL